MTLLQTWYHLSDYGIEEQVNDALSWMRFCGLQLEEDVPDHRGEYAAWEKPWVSQGRGKYL
jgi:IS5 family transposase